MQSIKTFLAKLSGLSIPANEANIVTDSYVVLGDVKDSLSALADRLEGSPTEKRLRRICLQLSVVEGGIDSIITDANLSRKHSLSEK